MTWAGADRTGTAKWKAMRRRVLRRDHAICHVCGKPGADEVDHLVALRLGGTDDEANLAPIHRRPCHARKSSVEGHTARWQKRKRPAEPHPGLKRGGG